MKRINLLRFIALCAAMLCAFPLWAENVITLTLSATPGEEFNLAIQAERGQFTIEGAKYEFSEKEIDTDEFHSFFTYTLTAEDGVVRIKGDITRFDCTGTKATKLDVSQIPTLKSLNCERNQLTNLDVSKNTNLEYLACSSNQLTSLDVSKNRLLKILSCATNQLTSLDLSSNTHLTYLDCSKNKLSTPKAMYTLIASLPYRGNVPPGRFIVVNSVTQDRWQTLPEERNICDKTQVTFARRRGWTAQERTYNSANSQWSTVNYAGSEPAAEESISLRTEKQQGEIVRLGIKSYGPFRIEGAEYKEADKFLLTTNSGDITIYGNIYELLLSNEPLLFDLSNSSQLEKLSCPESGLFGDLNLSRHTELRELHCPNNNLTRLDLFNNTKLEWLFCNKNQLTLLILPASPQLKGIYCSDNGLKSLNVTENPQLMWLECEGNQLNTLDVTNNPHLTKLLCSKNKLSSLDLSQNKELNELICTKNQLTTLELLDHPQLTLLECEKNQLSTLNVANSPLLEKLSCANNKLTALHLPEYTELKEVDCSMNQLSNKVVMDALIAALPDNSTSTNKGIFKVFDSRNDSYEKNLFDKKQARAALQKGWQPKEIKTVDGETILSDYKGCSIITLTTNLKKGEQISIRTQATGSVSFEGATTSESPEVITMLTAEDGNVSIRGNIKKLFCTTAQITRLDVSDAEELQALTCYKNELTTLDLTKNLQLEELDIMNNRFTTLDVSKNTRLRYLRCSSNSFASIDVSNNTLLEELVCDHNQITSLDVSKNTQLHVLSCYSNKITALDVSNQALLNKLECSLNKIAALDVSKNAKLTTLRCTHNLLTAIDVSQNLLLNFFECYNNQISAIDVSNNTQLTYFTCHKNSIRSLDLTKNTLLTRLGCTQNQISALDLSKNTALTYLSCFKNKLSSKKAMGALIASLPDLSASEKKGELTIVDFSTDFRGELLSKEENVCDRNQIAAARSKGWRTLERIVKGDDLNFKDYEGSEPVAIETILAEEGAAAIIAIYTVEGHRVAELQPGVNIIRLSNGTTRKVFVKQQ